MAFKEFPLDGGGSVKIYKHRAARSLRLSIAASGAVRVTIPTWAPYSAGLTFAHTRLDWIREQQPVKHSFLVDGQQIGKAHRLRLVSSTTNKISTRIRETEIIVSYPSRLAAYDTDVQKVATAASIRALRAQAERLLPQRLAELAARHGFTYTSVSVRSLKSRWGSCDQHKRIVLNIYLMQLPWQLIDYVLLHELTHTVVLAHGPKFWTAMEEVEPRAKQLRKAMRDYHPILGT